jgi:hypothetical protein
MEENNDSFIIIDVLNDGSYVKVIPEERKIIGYSTKNRGGVPDNFKNYFIVIFDKPLPTVPFLTRKGWTRINRRSIASIRGR